MKRNGVFIEDTFAEAFPMKATRLVVTAVDHTWVGHAVRAMTGFATSVIGCGVEAGVGAWLDATETPDGRPGAAVLLFAMSGKDIEKQVLNRVGQCVLTCPTTAVFSGLDGGTKPVPLGNRLRHFGDGWQISKLIDGRRYWRVPVMDGEFLCEGMTSRTDAVGGGNFLVVAATQAAALAACTAAVAAIDPLPAVITPFPGGVVRSGSKVGSRYRGLIASTNDAYCPSLRGLADSKLGPEAGAVLEIVIDGLTPADVALAMRRGIEAVCEFGVDQGIQQITAGNYGGKLGPHHFHLHEVLA